MVHFHSLWRWAFGRFSERTPVSTVDNRHVIAPAGMMEETLAWLEGRGYRAALVLPSNQPMEVPFGSRGLTYSGTKAVGKPGVLYGRKNEPLFLAQVGDVLVWDGIGVKIEE